MGRKMNQNTKPSNTQVKRPSDQIAKSFRDYVAKNFAMWGRILGDGTFDPEMVSMPNGNGSNSTFKKTYVKQSDVNLAEGIWGVLDEMCPMIRKSTSGQGTSSAVKSIVSYDNTKDLKYNTEFAEGVVIPKLGKIENLARALSLMDENDKLNLLTKLVQQLHKDNKGR